MPVNLDNAQFKLFLQFARQQTDGKAIARDTGLAAGAGPLSGHAIKEAKRDKVAPIGRRSGSTSNARRPRRRAAAPSSDG